MIRFTPWHAERLAGAVGVFVGDGQADAGTGQQIGCGGGGCLVEHVGLDAGLRQQVPAKVGFFQRATAFHDHHAGAWHGGGK
jgi:phosphoglycolate phosphatase-like HAD superfamily hydrolase